MDINTELKDLLHRRKLKATSSRLELLSLMKQSERAVSYSEIQQVLSDADRVTIYRTLNALSDHGIIHKAQVDGNDTYYAMCDTTCDDHHHHHDHVHFHCTKCGQVTCVTTPKPLNIRLAGHEIESYEVLAKGLCKLCA
jgi:Fur family ferric uptake transcriptional regulator